MSCEKCKEYQKTDLTAYYRWKNANVEMRGCDRHLKEIFRVLGKAQSTDRYERQEKELDRRIEEYQKR